MTEKYKKDITKKQNVGRFAVEVVSIDKKMRVWYNIK